MQFNVNILEYEISRSPSRPSTKHVAIVIHFTQQWALLAAVDYVDSTGRQRIRIFPVYKMVAKNCNVLLLNVQYNIILEFNVCLHAGIITVWCDG